MEAPHLSWQQRQQYALNNNYSETGNRYSAEGPASVEDDDGDLPDVPLELLPRFTDQDAKRELATLTIDDIVKLQADLTGMQAVASGMSGLNIGGNNSLHVSGVNRLDATGRQSTQMLEALDREMMKLPPSATDAFRQALAKCPGEVSAERRKHFLEREEGNPSLAARRLAKYWKFRLDTFGSEKCFLPMTLTGAMADQLMPMADRRVCQLLPCTDGAGRAIIYARLANRDFSIYSLDQEIMTIFYLIETIVVTNQGRDRGLVLLIDGRNTSRKHYSRKFPKYINIFDNVFPVRMRAFHICHPSNVMFYIIHPIVKRIMPKRIRLRVKLHHGTESEVLRNLSGYNLLDCIPTVLGGNVTLDMNQFLMDRMATEAAAFGIHLESVGQETDSSGAAGLAEVEAPPSKRPRGADGMDLMSPSSSHPAMSSASSAQSQPSPVGDTIGGSAAPVPVKSKKSSRKAPMRTGQRNVIDPRMALAVKAKQSDPNMKLYDALVAGGFVFTKDLDEMEMHDQDGTSLTQRKNNLCRRIRLEKQKKEKEAGKGKKDDDIVKVQDKGGPAQLAPQPSTFPSAIDSATAAAAAQGSDAVERRDSFLEEIMDLPDVGDFDIRGDDDDDLLGFLQD